MSVRSSTLLSPAITFPPTLRLPRPPLPPLHLSLTISLSLLYSISFCHFMPSPPSLPASSPRIGVVGARHMAAMDSAQSPAAKVAIHTSVRAHTHTLTLSHTHTHTRTHLHVLTGLWHCEYLSICISLPPSPPPPSLSDSICGSVCVLYVYPHVFVYV